MGLGHINIRSSCVLVPELVGGGDCVAFQAASLHEYSTGIRQLLTHMCALIYHLDHDQRESSEADWPA